MPTRQAQPAVLILALGWRSSFGGAFVESERNLHKMRRCTMYWVGMHMNGCENPTLRNGMRGEDLKS